MKRRTFIRLASAGAGALVLSPEAGAARSDSRPFIRLGGPVFEKFSGPEEWVRALKKLGYSAAYSPVKPGEDEILIKRYRKSAEENHIVIAEVGAWSNPISPDNAVAEAAMKKCVDSLYLADQIGAACCVNISGSRNATHWAGPHPENLTLATFDMIVETTRKIIDAVKPKNTWYTLEAMPWAFPDSVDSYLKLIRAIDRKQFAVHLDPVNFVSSPQVLFSNGDMIKESFNKLGRWIKSCHAKDVIIRENTYLPQLDEVRPGLGLLDYRIFLLELSKLPAIPLMMEHLKTPEEYAIAGEFIRRQANELNIEI